jgi:hypothetical protein
MESLPEDFLELCRSVTAKRARTVINHLLEHGQISTEELKNTYGYNHPPCAIRDVREIGIPIETFTITGSDGRKIAAYRFGNISKKGLQLSQGRTHLSEQLKTWLIEKYGCRCFLYGEPMPRRELQTDHRIPYTVAGDAETQEAEDFMLLCGSANRAKSWACEHCENGNTHKDKIICQSCYWAYPEEYSHIAMRPIRRLDILWQEEEVAQFDALKHQAEQADETLPNFVKAVLRKAFDAS